jgi:hypothetical protein
MRYGKSSQDASAFKTNLLSTFATIGVDLRKNVLGNSGRSESAEL